MESTKQPGLAQTGSSLCEQRVFSTERHARSRTKSNGAAPAHPAGGEAEEGQRKRRY
jgi:hypothetical protein